ncbi:LrgB family protein [Emergencia timonensis]|uniref:LrgB family protein n=1 Tax=Emergencia timonensis TaxID=1776384 RepID=UPI0039911F53
MNSFLQDSVFFGVAVSIIAYEAGTLLKKKFKTAIFNPLLIAVAATIVLLILCGIDYDSYYEGAKYLSYLLTPATVCLAIPMYEQMELLKKNWKAVMAGILSGVLTSLICILAMAAVFSLSHETYVTLLPKSITVAIGMGVSEELGGYVTITVAVILITGILGNMIGEGVCRLFRIKEPIARGVAIGTASHAIGTARAMEMGEVEGAMSSLSIAVAGLLTVAFASVFSFFW